VRLVQRLRRHVGWPLVLLVSSLSVAALAAVQAHRAAASHRRTASRLLHDYAAIAAWSYARKANDELLEVAWDVLNPILHRQLHDLPGWPDARDLVGYRATSLRECGCERAIRPATYLAWSLGADTLGFVGVPLDSASRRMVLDTLTRHLRRVEGPIQRMGIVAVRDPRATTLVAYGLMPMARGDTMVYAFVYDPASVAAGLLEVARDEELLPPAVTRGLSNDALLAVRVAAPWAAPRDAPDAATLAESPSFPRWVFRADTRLKSMSGGLAVRAAVRPEVAAALVAGGLPSSGRDALLLTLVAISGALALLAVRQLRREQELARLRADFVAGVSHELRTPLAQMRMFLETLRLGRWQTDGQREWLLGHVDRETVRLSQLVENVLTFSAAQRGGARRGAARSRARELADVGAEVTEAARAFEPLAAVRGATLRVIAVDDAVAPLDRAGFRQVLLNLLDNAVKYGPAGQTVTLRVSRADGVARVAVDDEGAGVPRGERARVWEPFFRGGGEGARVAGGSGIGLAVVREIVAAHGGRAWFDDAPGGGTRVVIELPATAEALEPYEGTGAAPDRPPATRARP
jgi:signal transduction histidine kinase